MISIQQMYFFNEIVKCGSISKAALSLGVSQPMLSRMVKNMENELGVPLLIRNTRSISLTDAGAIVRSSSAEIISNYEKMKEKINIHSNSQKGQVSFVCSGLILDCYISKFFPLFYKRYPDISVSVTQDPSIKVLSALEDGSADIGVMMTYKDKTPQLMSHDIISSEIALMVSKNHPFSKEKQINVESMKKEKIILTSNSSLASKTFVRLCNKQGFEPDIKCLCSIPEIIHTLVVEENAIAVMAKPLIEHYLQDDVICVNLTPKIPWDIAVVYKTDRQISNVVIQFRDCLLDFFNNYIK